MTKLRLAILWTIMNVGHPNIVCAQNLQSGLVGHYTFSGNAQDSSGNGNNGTVNGATLTTDRCGIPNSAYSFNGSSDYIDIGNALGTNPNQYSQSVWVRTTVSGNAPGGWGWVVLSKRHANDGSDWGTIAISGTAGNASCWYDDAFPNNGGSVSSVTFTAPNIQNLTDGNWHHVVGVRSGPLFTTYVNGVRELESTLTVDRSNGSTANMHVGNHGAWNVFFNGDIDDVRIYNRALNQQDVVQLFNLESCGGGGGGTPNPTSRPPGVVGWKNWQGWGNKPVKLKVPIPLANHRNHLLSPRYSNRNRRSLRVTYRLKR